MLGHALTEQQIEQYNKEGFLVVNSILTASDLTEIDHTIREMTDRALDGGEMSQILELEPEPVDGKRSAAQSTILLISTRRFAKLLLIREFSILLNR